MNALRGNTLIANVEHTLIAMKAYQTNQNWHGWTYNMRSIHLEYLQLRIEELD